MAETPQRDPQPATDPVIKLDQFLKLAGVVPTGGQAKQLIQAGQVRVNGEVENRRGRKLRPGDEVAVGGGVWRVRLDKTPKSARNRRSPALYP
jgi:Uncharacterized conserved protein, COG2501